jgi:hypothetical protein
VGFLLGYMPGGWVLIPRGTNMCHRRYGGDCRRAARAA